MFRAARSPRPRSSRAASRRLGRTGGTTAPGRLLLRLAPGALGRMARRARRRLGARVRHQRQDHHRGDARRVPRARRPPGGAQPRRLEHGLGRGDRAARRRPRARAARAVRGRRGVAAERGRAGRRRACCCSRTCSATSSTATASSSCSPTAGPSWSRRLDGRARFVLNADDPLVADLGRGREGVTYFGVEDDSPGAARAAARRRLQALPQLRHAPTSTRRSTSATWAATAARTAAASGPRPQVAATRGAARRDDRLARRAAHPAGRARARPPLPGLYNVYNARRGRRHGARAGRPAGRPSARRSRGSAARSAASRRSRSTGRQVSILLVKNPAGANEVLRTLTLEDGQLDLWLALNDRHRRRPRRLLDLGRRLRGAGRPRAARDLLGHARRGDGAAAEVRRDRRRAGRGPRPGALARRRRGERRRRAPVRAADLHGAARAARPAGPPRPGASGGRSDGRRR